ncbi:hypothetical protein DW220_11970 [Eubacterium sp. AM18-26]|nr:hypothetical protein DW220_11970 [Eubacterium sp. AM18-26]RHO22001.1 hypothetical protein DW212_12280 [Eubacterium sp. AM18-10LB-B]RHO28546.1 hypothetical protein DW208_09540 [Erysipelotrichaceae bacterium AM17-60]
MKTYQKLALLFSILFCIGYALQIIFSFSFHPFSNHSFLQNVFALLLLLSAFINMLLFQK